MGSTIIGTGMHVPDDVVTNDDLAKLMDTTEEWIRTRTGVIERRLAAPGTGTSDLAAAAGKQAIADAGIDTGDVDALIVATMTPDYYAPGSVPLVQDLLGLGAIPAYGLRQQCSGFLYGLDLADSLVKAGKASHVLVVGAEVHAGIQPWAGNWRDLQRGIPPSAPDRERNDRFRHWSVLFGDGAGAMVIADRDGDGVLGARLFTDGSLFDMIQVPAIGSKDQPFLDAAMVADHRHMPEMNGPRLYRHAVRLMPDAVDAVLTDAGLERDDVDIVVAHQANSRIIEGVAKRLGLPMETVPMNLDRYGNTTAGTLPILYHELRVTGRIPPGALVCFTAFGAGAHWGAALYREPA